jgi:hypothetical protein
MTAMTFRHLPSQAHLAWMMLHGRPASDVLDEKIDFDCGVAEDRESALVLVEEGDQQGCPHCQGVLSYCFLHSKRCNNAAFSLDIAHSSAAANSKYGQFALGCHFQRDEDHAQAFAQFQLSEAQGLDAAQFELGRCYEFGYGIAKDDAEARRLYQLAADQGFPEAFEVLSELAADAEEIYWFRRLAEDNLKLAQKRKTATQNSEKVITCLFASNIPNISNTEITQRFLSFPGMVGSQVDTRAGTDPQSCSVRVRFIDDESAQRCRDALEGHAFSPQHDIGPVQGLAILQMSKEQMQRGVPGNMAVCRLQLAQKKARAIASGCTHAPSPQPPV